MLDELHKADYDMGEKKSTLCSPSLNFVAVFQVKHDSRLSRDIL